MARCYNLEKKYSQFLDGELKGAEKQEFEKHISSCRSCGSQVHATKEVISSLTALPRYKTSSTFDIVLRSKLRGEMNKKPFFLDLPLFGSWSRVPLYAAAIVFLIATGIMLDRSLVRSSSSTEMLQAMTSQRAAALAPVTVTTQANSKTIKMKNYVLEQYSLPTYADKSTPADDVVEFLSQQRPRIDTVKSRSISADAQGLFRPASAMVRF